jgi:hypothetical protein
MHEEYSEAIMAENFQQWHFPVSQFIEQHQQEKAKYDCFKHVNVEN